MKNKVYFSINNQQREIQLFSIIERPNKDDNKFHDLQFNFMNHGLNFSSFDINNKLSTNQIPLNFKYKNPHISIHYNPKQEYLFIKKTNIEVNNQQFYKIKNVRDNSLYAPVLLRIWGDTTQNQFKKINTNNANININFDYNTDLDTLVTFVLVTKKGNQLVKDIEYPANYYEKDFKSFRLVIIYRLFNKRSIRETLSYFPQILKSKILNGYSWHEICNILNDIELDYYQKYLKVQSNLF